METYEIVLIAIIVLLGLRMLASAIRNVCESDDAWHVWFAWRPVRVEVGDRSIWVWRQWLERRLYAFYAGEYGYLYRFPSVPRTGNQAFDEYLRKEEERMEDDRRAFSTYMEKLKSEQARNVFNEFFAARATRAESAQPANFGAEKA